MDISYLIRTDGNFLEELGIDSKCFFEWLSTQPQMNAETSDDKIHDSNDECQSLIEQYLLECEDGNATNLGLRQSYYQFLLTLVLDEQNYNRRGQSATYLALNHIRDELVRKSLPKLPNFEKTKRAEWIKQDILVHHPETQQTVSRVINLYWTTVKHPLENNEIDAIYSDLIKSELLIGDLNVFYHGCADQNARNILQDGICLRQNNIKGSDFGAGFYVGKDFNEALTHAEKRTRLRTAEVGDSGKNGAAAVLIFTCSKEAIEPFVIKTLEVASKNDLNMIYPWHKDPLGWHMFVDNGYRPIPQRYHRSNWVVDAICGPQSGNAYNMQKYRARPMVLRTDDEQMTWQMCIRTTTLARLFYESISAVILVDRADE